MHLTKTSKQSSIHSTFVIERTYTAKPERVFAAFADPATKRQWFAEGDHHDVEHYQLDFREGGREDACFRFKPGTPLAGLTCTNNTIYHDIVLNSRIVFAGTMSIGDKHISASLGTIELLPADAGTHLIFTCQAAYFEGADGPEMREHGWNVLLGRLRFA